KCVDASLMSTVASTVVSTTISTTIIATTVSTAVSRPLSAAVSTVANAKIVTTASTSSSVVTTSVSSVVNSTPVILSSTFFSKVTTPTEITATTISKPVSAETSATISYVQKETHKTLTEAAIASNIVSSQATTDPSTSPTIVQPIASTTGTTISISSALPIPSMSTLPPPPLPINPPAVEKTSLVGSVKVATVNKMITLLGRTFPLLNAKSIADTVKTATDLIVANSGQTRRSIERRAYNFDRYADRKRDNLTAQEPGAFVARVHARIPARRRSVNVRDIFIHTPTCQIFGKIVTSVNFASSDDEGPTFGFEYTDITKFRHFYAQWIMEVSTQSMVGMFVANGYPVFNCSFPLENSVFLDPAQQLQLDITHAYSDDAPPVDKNQLLDLVKAEIQQLPSCSQKCLPEWSTSPFTLDSLNAMCGAWTDKAKTLVECVNSKCSDSQNVARVYSVMSLFDTQCSTLKNQIFGLSYSLNADSSKIVLGNPDNIIVAGPGAVASISSTSTVLTTAALLTLVPTVTTSPALTDIITSSGATVPAVTSTTPTVKTFSRPNTSEIKDIIQTPLSSTKFSTLGGGKTNVLASSSITVIPTITLALFIFFV
ncbi:hypothetical protein HDU99_009694, partial [Rhizoclosmatium hyalinum]